MQLYTSLYALYKDTELILYQGNIVSKLFSHLISTTTRKYLWNMTVLSHQYVLDSNELVVSVDI